MDIVVGHLYARRYPGYWKYRYVIAIDNDRVRYATYDIPDTGEHEKQPTPEQFDTVQSDRDGECGLRTFRAWARFDETVVLANAEKLQLRDGHYAPERTSPILEAVFDRHRIRGEARNVSKRFVRAWIIATTMVLAYHHRVVRIRSVILDPVLRENDHAGTWCPTRKRLRLCPTLHPQEMATAIVHEVIHAAGCDTEWETSTLTAKLKPEIAPLAQLLLDGSNRRAGFFAHLKTSYRRDPDQGDAYNTAEDEPIASITDPFRK